MSYSINDGIRDGEQALARAKQICERFPDAYLDQQRFWVSNKLKPEACDHVQVGPNDVMRVGTLVQGEMVAMPIPAMPFNAQTVAALLRSLKDNAPELFLALAQFAANGRR